MQIEIKVPSPGESITEVMLANWLVEDGSFVEKDSEIVEIDSDKATLTLSAEESGVLKILVQAGETVPVKTVIGTLEVSAEAPKKTVPAEASKKEEKPSKKPEIPQPAEKQEIKISPLAKKLMQEKNIGPDEVVERLRIRRDDVVEALENPAPARTDDSAKKEISRQAEHKKLSPLRQKLSERLVAVKNETAMLTTFNEINMSAVLDLKKRYGTEFKEKYGIGIGFMSLFTKAVTVALKLFPQVNAQLSGDELLSFDYCDIGIAVSAPKGLVVPVIRNAETLSIPEIEIKIKELSAKARENRITIEEMNGGTFTITNGGVFGSLMSTPILNPPQSAILGMHNIVERPIARNGQVVIAPMMYVALSYDHRVIDGRESVGFLVKVKELIEDPAKILFAGEDGNKLLLGI